MFHPPTTKKPHPKVLLFGDAKCGKTAFCLSAGLGDKPVAVIDSEAGTDLMAGGFAGPDGILTPKMEVLHTQDPVELVKALDYLAKHAGDFSALAIDSATVIWEMSQDAFMNANTGRVKLNEWNAVKLPIRRAYHRIMDLPLPTLFSCRLKTVYRKEGREMVVDHYAPDFEKAASYIFDLVLEMRGPKHNYAAHIYGSRMHELPAGTVIEHPTWARIMEPIAHRFDATVAAHAGDNPEDVGQKMYGADGMPEITPEELVAKVSEAKALAHLQNIWRKHKATAKKIGCLDAFTAAKDARKAELTNTPPVPDVAPPAEGVA